jgi:hypothetical protein
LPAEKKAWRSARWDSGLSLKDYWRTSIRMFSLVKAECDIQARLPGLDARLTHFLHKALRSEYDMRIESIRAWQKSRSGFDLRCALLSIFIFIALPLLSRVLDGITMPKKSLFCRRKDQRPGR